MIRPPGYRDNAIPSHAHPLEALCGTFEVQMNGADRESVRFNSKDMAVYLSMRGFEKLSPPQRAAIAALIDTGKLRVTIEVIDG